MDTDRSIYVTPEDRFVVMLAVGYLPEDAEGHCADNPMAGAAYLALDLTRDLSSYSTHWLVLDRQSGEVVTLEQRDFDHDEEGSL